MKTLHKILIPFLCFLIACNSDKPRKKVVTYNDAAVLQFANMIEKEDLDSNFVLHTGWYFLVDSNYGIRRSNRQDEGLNYIAKRPFIPLKNFADIELTNLAQNDNFNSEIMIILDEQGRMDFESVTRKAMGNNMALVIANQLIVVAKIQGVITAGKITVVLKNYAPAELKSLKRTFKYEKQTGKLPQSHQSSIGVES